jgi:hypothetical protein
MGPLSALADGLRRVARAPAVLAGTFALTLLVALPLSLALRGMIAAHFGPSLAADAAARSADYDWWQEFSAQATGLGTTFVPSIIGFGAVLQNISNLADNAPLATTIAGVTAAWLVLWSFLSGGIIDRVARNRATRARGFFGACGAHFPALIRLGLISLVVYWLVFRWIHPWLFESLFMRATRNIAVEREAFLIRLLLYLVFALVLIAVNVIFDYARVRIVVEDRRSAVGALLAGSRFAGHHTGAVATLYALNAILFLLLVAAYGIVTLVVSPAGRAAWLALVAGEAYILARHYLKLTFYASETAMFQARLAHADYTAAPPVVWPESPLAESVGNAPRLGPC